jgi:hypothetical protein
MSVSNRPSQYRDGPATHWHGEIHHWHTPAYFWEIVAIALSCMLLTYFVAIKFYL